MRSTLAIASATAIAGALLVWAWNALGASSIGHALLTVWIPMVWLGTISRLVTPRLPDRYHRLRGWERDGRMYELLGVRIVKALLRRGPMAEFNPHLHLPAERTPDQLARLDQRMRDAEASHAILLVAMLPIVAHAAIRGWWPAALTTLTADVALNGYPVMLQRYNRALLRLRFPDELADLPTGG